MAKITSLKELRATKRELKQEMAIYDQNAKNGFFVNTLNKFVKNSSTKSLQTPIGTGVNTALNLISKQAQSKFNLGKTGKTVLSVAILIATPIIVKKVQEFIDDKF